MQQRDLLDPAMAIAAMPIGAALCAVGWRWRRGFVLLLIGLALIGFASADWRASQRLAETLASDIEGRDLRLTGVVASLPQAGHLPFLEDPRAFAGLVRDRLG